MAAEASPGASKPAESAGQPKSGPPAVGTKGGVKPPVAEPWDEIGPYTTSFDPLNDPW